MYVSRTTSTNTNTTCPEKKIELGELSDFSRDYGTQIVEDVMFENDIYVIAMKEALQMPPSDLRWREVK